MGGQPAQRGEQVGPPRDSIGITQPLREVEPVPADLFEVADRAAAEAILAPGRADDSIGIIDARTRDSNGITTPVPVTGAPFVPSVDNGVGWGPITRVEANLTALRTLRRVQGEDRVATADEQQDLSRWTSWGAVPAIFDESKDVFRAQRQELSDLLDPVEWAAARRTTINAHYTDPAYVQAIWNGLGTLGFPGGNVLEPGSGVGLFIGLAPASARMVGVELDPVTAAISAALYPDATIRAESFADSPFPDASFDAVVGNVPFADVKLRDRRHNPDGLSMHNHFIVKSLALTRPGGMVAVLTSRYTMDAKDRSAREAMSAMGDLVTAVRLPSGAHQKYAGTEAATDLLVFQRRVDGVAPANTSWLDVQSHLVQAENPAAGEPDQVPVTVNAWWSTHPQSVIGHEVVAHGMYGVGLVVRPDDPTRVTQDVTAAITRAIEGAAGDDGWSFTAPEPDRVRVDLDQVVTPVARMGDVRQFACRVSYDEQTQGFTQFIDGLQVPFAVPQTQHQQMRALLGLRDDVTAVLAQEASDPDDTSELSTLRAGLNEKYDAYVARFGPVGSVKLSDSWSKNKKTGEMQLRTRRSYPGAVRLFEADPHSAIVKALENYDEATNTATKAPVFNRRVVSPQITRDHADTPADAVSIALDSVGEVRLEDVARLLDVSEQQARAQLGTDVGLRRPGPGGPVGARTGVPVGQCPHSVGPGPRRGGAASGVAGEHRRPAGGCSGAVGGGGHQREVGFFVGSCRRCTAVPAGDAERPQHRGGARGWVFLECGGQQEQPERPIDVGHPAYGRDHDDRAVVAAEADRGQRNP